jgi:UDP-N-acetylmuramoylalanine--D-glutamate ligase
MTTEKKKILIVGGGRSGAAAAAFLAARGDRVTLTDRRTELASGAEAERLRALGVTLALGAHAERDFLDADEIVVSPGVPLTIEPLRGAVAAGVPIIGELELAARHLKGRIVAVTGSNGKTTTTTLIGEILKDAGFATQVGGNIGTAAISLADASRDDGFTVLECSSFQLETVQAFRPQVGVLLNITPDHLDRHGSFEAYADAKRQMFRNHGVDTLAVLNADDPSTPKILETLARRSASTALFSRTRELEEGMFVRAGDIVCRTRNAEKILMNVRELQLRGGHNVENVLAALCAALACGAAPESARRTIQNFRGVEHRLEFVAEINGVSFFNDSKATNVDASIKALEAFPENLHAILGGKDKDGDYAPLAPLLSERAKTVLLIGAAAEKIARALDGRLRTPAIRSASLEDAVRDAFRRAVPGDVVLLAPACASFDMFQNFEHRGAVFKSAVAQLHDANQSRSAPGAM